MLLAAGEQIDNAAANGELAAIMYGVGADIAIALEHGGEARDRDPLLGREMGDELPHAERGERPLRHGGERGDDQLRGFGRGLQRVQARKARRGGAQRGAGPVIGQAVPGGDFDDPDLRREIMGGVGDGAHLLLIGGDE